MNTSDEKYFCEVTKTERTNDDDETKSSRNDMTFTCKYVLAGTRESSEKDIFLVETRDAGEGTN